MIEQPMSSVCSIRASDVSGLLFPLDCVISGPSGVPVFGAYPDWWGQPAPARGACVILTIRRPTQSSRQMGNLADVHAFGGRHDRYKPDGGCVNGPAPERSNRMADRYLDSTGRFTNGRLNRSKVRFGHWSRSVS